MTLTTDPLFVQSLAKGMRLLEAFSDNPGPLSLNALAQCSDMDRSATQRMAHTLVALGYLERGENGRGYVLGKKFLDRTFDFLRSHPLIERATPVLIDVQKEADERVDLSLFDDTSIIYALRHQTKRQSFYATLVGRRLPSFCTSGGNAAMSCLSDEAVRSILDRSNLQPMTAHTVTAIEQIFKRIVRSRDDGYVLLEQEARLGEIVLASPIVNRKGEPVGAVHIAGSLSDWTAEPFAKRFAPLAITAARALNG